MKRLLEQYQSNAWARSVADNYRNMSWSLKAWFVITHYVNKCRYFLTVASMIVTGGIFWKITEHTWMVGDNGLISDSTLWPYFYLAASLVFVFHWALPTFCNVIFNTWFDSIKSTERRTR